MVERSRLIIYIYIYFTALKSWMRRSHFYHTLYVKVAWLKQSEEKPCRRKSFFIWLSTLCQRLHPLLFSGCCHSIKRILKTCQPHIIMPSSRHVCLCSCSSHHFCLSSLRCIMWTGNTQNRWKWNSRNTGP